MNIFSYITMPAGLILSPLLVGIINRTKAIFAGRRGAPLLQSYYDIGKLLRKGAVYSQTTTWVFRIAPSVCLTSVIGAFLFIPVLGSPAPMKFAGDIILFIYFLGLMRFFAIIAALDTGSSFEGMGASREVQFSILAEPVLIVGLATLVRVTGSLSLSGIFLGMDCSTWLLAGPALVLVLAALIIIFLAENARIPVDDPNTHLELTMIHEVMILDYSGPDLAFILYGASLKLWVLGALIVNLLLSFLDLNGGAALCSFTAGMFILAIAIGVIESVMARLSLLKVPQLLVGAGALSILAFILVVRFIS